MRPRHMIEHPITTDAPDGFNNAFVPAPALQTPELRSNRRILRGNDENQRWLDKVVPEVIDRVEIEMRGPTRGTSPFSPPPTTNP